MNKKISTALLSSILIFGIASCNGTEAETKEVITSYVETTKNSIYGVLSDFSKLSSEVVPGDKVTFKATPSEDFYLDQVTNNGVPCKVISYDQETNTSTLEATIFKGQNKLTAKYYVDKDVDFVDKFKLNITDEIFNEVMNPTSYASDKKLGLDFRRCGIEQCGAPNEFGSNGIKKTSSNFVNYVDGDTTHVETLNLQYTVKIRYLGIDTPESTSEIEKWGLSASYYSKAVYSGDEKYISKLDADAKAYIQDHNGITSLILLGQSASFAGEKIKIDDLKLGSEDQGTYYATTDGNQRNLAYVWYATVQNPTKADFRCLNLEMAYQGFSNGIGSIEEMGEYYYRFFDKANLSAQINGRHRYSNSDDANYYDYEEKDPIEISLEHIYKTILQENGKDSVIKYYPSCSLANAKTLYKVHGYVTRKVGTSFYIQDKPSYTAEDLKNSDPYGLYVFTFSETPITVGDEINVIGALSVYGGTIQMQGISYHTLNPNPVRDTQILSRGNEIVPIKMTGAEFNSKCYPQVLVEITDTLWFYDFTSTFSGVQESLAEGGVEAINQYNEAYPFYNTDNKPIVYVAFGEEDNCRNMNKNPASYGGNSTNGLRYSNQVIRFTVDSEILVTHGIDTCYSYKFFVGGNYIYNPHGAEYANYDETNKYLADTRTVTNERKVATRCLVISHGYESTSGNKKMSATICSNQDLTLYNWSEYDPD